MGRVFVVGSDNVARETGFSASLLTVREFSKIG